MNRRGADGDRLEVRTVEPPRQDNPHRPFILASLVMATLVGFVLGIHVPLGRLLDAGSAERTADLVQAHGQVQLLGFAGLFVIGMSLRLMPRFAGSRIAFEPLVPVTLVLFVVALVLRAVVMPWTSGDLHSGLLVASAFGVLVASACFLLVAGATLGVVARRFDASSLAFVLGAALLFASAVATAFAVVEAVDDGNRALPYLANNAIVQLQMAGFLFSFILGVALRAIPAMVGIERPGRSAGLLAVGLAAAVTLLGAALLYLEYADNARAVVYLADAGFIAIGLVLLGLAWQAGVLRQAANRIRPSSQPNLWVIRSAFAWLVFAAVATLYFGVTALLDGELPGQGDFDAVRHALGVGVISLLIAGMSMMILPEFAVERQRPNRQHELAFLLAALLNLATLLRVLPALAGTRWSFDERNLSMAVAGSLAEVALLIFALYLARLFLRQQTR